jgi:hypothetical protein
MPNISIGLTWVTMIFATYISWTEEQAGEDGLDILSSESEGDDASSLQFKKLETSSD